MGHWSGDRRSPRWMARGLAAPRVAVNVSAVQLRQRDFVDLVKHALVSHHLRGRNRPSTSRSPESVIMKDVETNVSSCALFTISASRSRSTISALVIRR